MYTASIYFMGQYRPAYFQAETAHGAQYAALVALANHPDYQWFASRLQEAYSNIIKPNCSNYSAEHGTRGVSIAKRPHDPFLDGVTRSFPDYPGLDYSGAINA